MAKFTQFADGTVCNQVGEKVGIVIAPQGVKGINGAAFYRNDQIKGGTLLKDGEADKGAVIGRRELDAVVSDALSL